MCELQRSNNLSKRVPDLLLRSKAWGHVCRFQDALRELVEGLDAWELMEDRQAKSFQATVTAAFSSVLIADPPT